MHHKARSQELQDCIQSCKDCHEICVDTAAYCLSMGGHHVAAKHMTLLLDCIEICATSQCFMQRGSQAYAELCGMCADVCESCAAVCDAFSGDPQMEACASACQSCADACQKVATSQASRKP